ncbi:MAG: bifunctional serine/threonine-protein kinase/formylglycine-generating enzyme family protein [Chloroflexota bacterium]
MTDLTGSTLGRYRILSLLGEGGMAIVYKAYDTRLEREVALKMIRKGAFPADHLERMLKRFEREAKALARLSHPNIIKILDYGEYEGSPYLVMEYFPGGTLKGKLGKPIPWQEAIQLILPIAEALDYAHDQNMVHRDVKPANILLTQRGQPMLSDFGIAKLLDLDETRELTGTSAALGTPEYMAPEQARAKNVDHRADIYSLGIVLYEMVTGRKPFIADTPMDVMIMHARDPLPDPKKFARNLPNGLVTVLQKALAKQPAERYQSMEEFAAALKALSAGKPASISKPAPKPPRREETVSESDTIKDFKVPPLDTDSPSLEGKGSGIRSGVKSKLWLPASFALLLIICIGLAIKSLPSILSPIETPSLTPTKTLTFTPELTFTSTFTLTPEFTATSAFTPTLTPLPTDIWDSKNVIMRLIPAGTFPMGSNDGNSDERPVHDVYLDAYYIDTYEVTNALYKTCVDAGVCDPPVYNRYPSSGYQRYDNTEYQRHPVMLNWSMSKKYCEWRGADLPTEAQWEKAARGTDGRTYPWGEGIDCTKANYDRSCVGDTTAVGSYESGKSPYGIYDMAGNALEWVKDWYMATYYKTSPIKNPLGPDNGIFRVLRGGEWWSSLNNVRASFRNPGSPDNSFGYGFRCARPAQ